MFNMLELSGLFVYREGLSFLVSGGQKKLPGLGFLGVGGITTQTETTVIAIQNHWHVTS